MTASAVSTHVSQPPPVAAPPPKLEEYNRIGLDFRKPFPPPPVRGTVFDFHTHLLAARHAPEWFEAGEHFGFQAYFTMAPLEEALSLQRDWGHRLHFIAIPRWGGGGYDEWMQRIDGFYNLGSRILKFHLAPRMMHERKWRLDSPEFRRMIKQAVERNMILMSHVGDPDTWYANQYADASKYGTREEHYRMWVDALASVPDHPWLGAHLGGNPENLPRLQSLLDRFPNLYLDCSATRWMVREISARRDEAREFFLRNQDRILFGTDNVSGDNRNFDFLASRFWCHRMLWETDYVGPSPIHDPDLPAENQPTLRGLALPPEVIQKMYHDNGVKLLARVGAKIG